jgi:hypothetical protein
MLSRQGRQIRHGRAGQPQGYYSPMIKQLVADLTLIPEDFREITWEIGKADCRNR